MVLAKLRKQAEEEQRTSGGFGSVTEEQDSEESAEFQLFEVDKSAIATGVARHVQNSLGKGGKDVERRLL